jgi:hypothetical protein
MNMNPEMKGTHGAVLICRLSSKLSYASAAGWPFKWENTSRTHQQFTTNMNFELKNTHGAAVFCRLSSKLKYSASAAARPFKWEKDASSDHQ